jgi:alpha-tubulin suppressor-like RCC1 family protein
VLVRTADCDGHDNGSEPERLEGSLAGRRVVQVATGYDHSLALCDDGTLHAWGQNDWLQCTGTAGEVQVPAACPYLPHRPQRNITRPREIALPPGCEPPLRVYAGADSSAVLDKNGAFYIWGDLQPACRVSGVPPLQHACLGPRRVFALDLNGRVVKYERIQQAPLPHEPDPEPHYETSQPYMELSLAAMGASTGHVVAITAATREIVTWGIVGRLGNGHRETKVHEQLKEGMSMSDLPEGDLPTPEELNPIHVPLFVKRPARDIAVGPTHQLALFEELASKD